MRRMAVAMVSMLALAGCSGGEEGRAPATAAEPGAPAPAAEVSATNAPPALERFPAPSRDGATPTGCPPWAAGPCALRPDPADPRAWDVYDGTGAKIGRSMS